MEDNRSDWDEKLDFAQWSFRTAFKVATGVTPFRLVYGLEAVVPMEYIGSSLRIAIQQRLSPDKSILHRQRQLLKLEEDRLISSYMAELLQNKRKAWIDRQVKFKIFQKGDWVMMYNSKLGPHPGKLKLRYFGPYQIMEELGQGTFRLRDIFGTPVLKPINGFRLKQFYGHVPDIPRWMVNKAADVGVRFVEVELLSQNFANLQCPSRSHISCHRCNDKIPNPTTHPTERGQGGKLSRLLGSTSRSQTLMASTHF